MPQLYSISNCWINILKQVLEGNRATWTEIEWQGLFSQLFSFF